MRPIAQLRTARAARVLVVDDDVEVRDFVRATLERAGYEVTTAESGHRLLERIRALGRPDLELLDYQMPGLNGVQVMDLLGGFVIGSRVPVVFCSGNSDRRVLSQALARGARDYLLKPFFEEDLLSVVHANLGAARNSIRST